MSHSTAWRPALLVLTLAMLSLSLAPPAAPPQHSPLAEARYKAALKEFEEIWTFYRQSRTNSFLTYYWSRLVLDSQQELCDNRADRIAAFQAHLERMKQLEALVLRVRKLGFGFSTDVGAVEYYRLEAERWLEKERPE